MASADEYAAWIVKNADRRGSPEFDVVARAYADAKASLPAHKAAAAAVEGDAISQGARNFADDMGGIQKFVAGYGAAVPRLLRGAGQRLGEALPDGAGRALGLPTQADVDEANRLDAPLLATGAGAAGNIVGNVALAAPAVAIPAAATIPGAAVIGAFQGLATPTSTGESPLTNAAIGGAAGAGGIVLGRAANSLYQGAKSLIEPFTAAGRDRIGGRVLEQFGVGTNDVAGLTGNPTITGARTTLAEQIADPAAAAGAAGLQGGLRSVDPRAGAAMTAREAENNAARVATLTDLSGAGGARDAAAAAREATAGLEYRKAFINPSLKLNAAGEAERDALLNMPAIQKAMRAAQENAANRGVDLSSPEGSARGLHAIKLALDDAYTAAKGGRGTPAQAEAADAIKAAQTRLVAFLEDLRPAYANARQTYAAMSRPINQMDVAAEALRRGTAATGDLAGTPRLMPNSLLTALRDEPALIRQATGRDLGGSLDTLLEPDQLSKLRGVASEVDRAAAVARAENGPGSATAQRLASQNVLRQALGPTGLPQSWSESTLLNTAMRPVQFAYNQVAEPRIQQVLAEAILDPSKAAGLLQAAQAGRVQLPQNALLELAAAAGRVTPSSAAANWPK